jgi:hypothetical protein
MGFNARKTNKNTKSYCILGFALLQENIIPD